ncbi:hypothetical protein JA1_000993 [Spathaspora sp. JA1]|nr:hypothetical protein JA1_000993 [Spathaspora sp. JA1]
MDRKPQTEADSSIFIDSSLKDIENQHHENIELTHHTKEEIEADGKWYNKEINLLGFKFRYSSGMTQIVMLAFVIFMTPGMFNALSGIGVSIGDQVTANNANVALYSTFATIGFFGGTICNIIGVRLSLMVGGTGYALYAGSLLAFNHTECKWFVILAGAVLGVCAAILWAAQGTIIMSYPTESTKGRAIMVFWVIFNMGGVIGSIIPLVNNLQNQTKAANDGTFIAFIILMCLGSVIASFMLPMSKVYKADGTKVSSAKQPYWKDELIALGKLLINEPRILLMFPMFFASNWFYTYQFNNVNRARFNLRTRSLNSLLYWLAQMLGAVIIGSILDWQKFRRSVRAKLGFIFLFVTSMAIWGGGLKFQLAYTRESAEAVPPLITPLDFTDAGYVGPVFLYIFYGMFDAIFQSYIFWVLGALSNNPKKTALYAGFYKGIQSAGAAIAWRLDAIAVSYMVLFSSSWALCQGSLLIAAPLIFYYIKDTTTAEEDHMEEVVGDEEFKKDYKS